ncbi:putative proline iminopeptidase [Tilletiaria anomala UBC 951]|uniref:Proline iminopeptidase n=1 Tax=Tilletiaria anomala (strain ATCC 24038 / CBS 436.72 / UBC 951) TaxID=1037660 RepID=A0A066WEM4_TILAU|nr:putative proline iminopeptidase [Tilletiaria anomala UBC 951]KDN49210.1 putative proline iminopeptidase [Tilletiaria anomala UBC 951]
MPDYAASARSLEGHKKALRQLYPPIDPYESGRLKVDDTHELYWEWCGKPGGVPVVFLHGGPGGGVGPGDRRWFDPQHYRVLCFDQRGAGRSTPPAELKNNTTWDLVADIEKLRAKFGIDRWLVFGGSWGSTLALAYAQQHPDRVVALVLRGIFTLRKAELRFFYQDGAGHMFPEMFQAYREYIPERERADLMKAYYKRLTHKDPQVRLDAARRWSTWENATSNLYVDPDAIARGDDDQWALQFARIEAHFFINNGWMKDGQLLEARNIDRIRSIPAVIVQGRYDVVCPAATAWNLHERWPEAQFHLVPDAGHSAREPGIAHLLLEATDKFRSLS